MFHDLYEHMEWADAVVWTAVMSSDATKKDKRIRELLAHLHLTQSAFLSTWRGQAFQYRDSASFKDADEVLAFAREYYRHLTFDDKHLDKPITMPWAERFRKAPQQTTLRDTLLQVPMHSTYHRGQVNARIREAGGTPPLTDYIAWIWMGRPKPQWP